MRKLVLLACCVFVVSLLPAEKITFKVMQLNIWLEGTEVSLGFEAIVNEVMKNDVDVVTFNEVQNINHTPFNERLLKALKEKGKTYYSFYAEDSGIISKYPILSSASVYPEKADTGSIYKAIILIGDKKVAVYSSHLDYQHYACYLPRGYSGDTWKKIEKPVTNVDSILKSTRLSMRMEEITAVIADAGKEIQKGHAVIIGGDFNEPSGLDWVESTKNLFDHHGVVVSWPVSSYLNISGFIDAYRHRYPNPVTHPGFTYPTDNPDATINKLTWAPDVDERERIDFIYYKPVKGLKLLDVVIVGPTGCIVKNKRTEETSKDRFIKPSGVWPSDHKAVMTTFELTTGTF